MRESVYGTDRSYRILVADDDPLVIATAEVALKAYGYEVVTAADGVAAWGIVNAEPIDLALVDLIMPGLDGFDFIARCRLDRGLENLPIVVVTAAAEEDICARAFSLGATDYLIKPVLLPLLSHTVWYILRNEAREAEIRSLRALLQRPQQPAAA